MNKPEQDSAEWWRQIAQGLQDELRTRAAEYETLQQRAIGELDAANQHVKIVQEQRDDSARTVRSIAVMLGWGNVPPRETLEADIRALKARLEAAEARAIAAEARAEAAEAAEAQVAILEVRKDNRNAKQAWENGFIAGKEAALASPVTDAAEPQKEQDLGLLGSTVPGDSGAGAPRREDGGGETCIDGNPIGQCAWCDLRADGGLPEAQGARCQVPPAGWWCSREAGHDGPCAARPMPSSATTERSDEASGFRNHNGLNDHCENENTTVTRSEGTRE